MGGNNIFSNIFGQSPIRPIQCHMTKAHECASCLTEFFDAVVANDWVKAESIQQRIVGLEHEADEFKREIRQNLPKSLFMPVPRSDLLEVVAMQDNIANRTKDIAGIMLGCKMSLPQELHKTIPDFTKAAVETSAQASRAIEELDELLETGFGGREIIIIEKLIKQLDMLENQADQLEVKVRAQLFEIEKTLNPIDVMFLYKVIDWIGDLADKAQKVGSRLSLLLAR